jgi:predicted transcriptional regulator
LSRKTVVLLIAVYRAEKAGLRTHLNAVTARLTKVHNNGSEIGDRTLMEYLVRRGYLSKKKEGRSLILSSTVSGRNYVESIAKSLRELKRFY